MVSSINRGPVLACHFLTNLFTMEATIFLSIGPFKNILLFYSLLKPKFSPLLMKR